MDLKAFFDDMTNTVTYVVYDSTSLDAICIDPVFDLDLAAGSLKKDSFNRVKDFIDENNLNLHFVMETHVHADHLSASQVFKEYYPSVKIVIGHRIEDVIETFSKLLSIDGACDARTGFDLLVKEGDCLRAGTIEISVLETPGHTPACVSYHIQDMLFTGDALFMPDMGTGRCDFPQGSAEDLYDSIMKIYALPENVKIFVGHDYAPGDREDYCWETSVGEQRDTNIQIKGTTTREEFVSFRRERDSKLGAPKLLYPSIQVNMQAGHLPSPDENGKRFFKIPITEC